jgi:hypothetical protein
MKRLFLGVVALALMVVLSALALQAERRVFPLLDWAGKAAGVPARSAVLVELGLKDLNVRDWSGKAEVSRATVVHREGYRFRTDDKLVGQDAWEASSHRSLRAPKNDPVTLKREPIATVGVVLQLEAVKPGAKLKLELKGGEKAEIALDEVLAGKPQELWKGEAQARLISAALPIAVENTEDDFPAAAYGPDGTLWVAYISYTVRDDKCRIEQPMFKEQPKDFKDLQMPEYSDQLWLRAYKDGKWGTPQAVTGPKEDLARCAVAVDGAGHVTVAYSAHRNDGFHIYARKSDAQGNLGEEQRLTINPGPDLTPVMCTDATGAVWIAWQSWDKGNARVKAVKQNAKESEVFHIEIGAPGENAWHPALAAAPDGRVSVACDVYRNGSYDVVVHTAQSPNVTKQFVASSARFEARPSIVYDRQNRLWIAYEEGPEGWGKDYGAFVAGKGNPLYNERSTRVVCLDADGKLKKPTAELPTSRYEPPALPFDAVKTAFYEKTQRYSYPRLGLDGQGRLWLSYRRNFGTRYSSHPGSYSVNYLRRLDGETWSDEVEMSHSDGLLDNRPVLLPHASGGLLTIHNTDGRYTTPEVIDNQVYASVITLPARPTVLQLAAHEPGTAQAAPQLAGENEAVRRMRTHKIEVAGKSYNLYRGEYHRHTEISWDGGADGSLEDMFRYAHDAGQLDWIGNGDHDNGAGREYSWWLVQKFSDAYLHPGFTPMFTYERSVAYPHGHRNVMFAQRGVRTLARLAPPVGEKVEGGVHPDDTKMLYRYLHAFNGLCASHTSATSMGTDWRDNDPVREPIVEIYQGDRMSYEFEGAPRSGNDPKTGIEPANVAGWFPKGFINLALGEKGYKLAFQSSSDHWSTHISFFIIMAEGRDRKSLLDAVLKRRCYGATDNILVDFRCGDHLMGEELTSTGAPTFRASVIGTGKLAKVEILRDSNVIATLPSSGAECKGEWTDPQPRPGTHYYYLRVQQSDGELAWGSPIWVTLKK